MTNLSLPYILLSALGLIGVLCVMGVVRDLRTGTSRLAHDEHDVLRQQLPLNFWLAIGSKVAGAAMALVLAIAVVTRLL